MTLSKTTQSIMILSIMILSKTTLIISKLTLMTLSMMTLNIMTLSVMALSGLNEKKRGVAQALEVKSQNCLLKVVNVSQEQIFIIKLSY